MKVEEILSEVDNGVLALPVFQRGFVWSEEKIQRFLRSLYNGYPVGCLLIWRTADSDEITRGESETSGNYLKIIIDGQQRITTIYAMARGKTPPFFIGKSDRLKNVFFDIEEEKFVHYKRRVPQPNPFLVNVTEILKDGTEEISKRIFDQLKERYTVDQAFEQHHKFKNRLDKLYRIRERDIYEEVLTDESRNFQDILIIFQEVNTGSKQLSGADLALARVCAKRFSARDDLQACLDEWAGKGYKFSLDWLLRCVNVCITGGSTFDSLDGVTGEQFDKGLLTAKQCVEKIIILFQTKLGIDDDKLLGMRACIPLLVRYFAIKDGNVEDESERAKLLYWYLQTVINQRYYGGTEGVLRRDLEALTMTNDRPPIENLISTLKQDGIDKQIQWHESYGAGRNNVFFQLLYVLSRANNARDIFTRDPLSFSKFQPSLEKHHIFPSALLQNNETKSFSKRESDDVANFAFLTRKTNRRISAKEPSVYLSEVDDKLLKTQWIPTDRSLWKIEKYPDFLAKRRQLLAAAADTLLGSLEAGRLPDV